jgi:hypothetical protein
MAKTSLEFVGEERVTVLIDKMNAAMEKLRQENQKLAEESQEGQKKTKSAIEESVKSLATMAAGYVSVQAALRLVNSERERELELNKQALDAQEKLAGPQAKYFANLPAGIDRKVAESRISDMASQLRVSQESIYSSMNEARPTASRLSLEQQMAALGQAARLHPGEQMGGVQSAIQSIMEQSNFSATDAAGFLQRLGQRSGSGLDDAAQRLLPTIAQMESGTIQERGAIAAAISADPKFAGERGQRLASTLSVGLAQQLEKEFPEENRYTFEGGRKRLAAKGTGLTSVESRLEFLQAHPELQAKFFAEAGFGARESAAAHELIAGGPLADSVRANLKAFATASAPDTSLDSSNFTQANAATSRSIEQQKERANLSKPGRTATQQARNIYETFLDETNTPWYLKTPSMWGYDVSTANGVDFAEGRIGQSLQALQELKREGHQTADRGMNIDKLIKLEKDQIQELRNIRANQNRAVNPDRHD